MSLLDVVGDQADEWWVVSWEEVEEAFVEDRWDFRVSESEGREEDDRQGD